MPAIPSTHPTTSATLQAVRMLICQNVLMIVLLCANWVGAQTVAVDPSVGLAESIEAARQQWHVPGVAVAVVHRGETILADGFGELEVGKPLPVDEHSLFAIASNTKAFTTAGLALLVEEGKLKWEHRVRDYLPYFELHEPSASAQMTVRDLVCHRSGLGTFSGDLLWFGTPYAPSDILRRARLLRPSGTFRADYGYSNLMYLAAGEVLSAASGQTWKKFITDRILVPLKMDRTVTSVTELTAMQNVATPHKSTGDQSEPLAWYNWDTMMAAGGLISSAHDMSLWLKLQLQKGAIDGARRLYREDAAEEMWAPQTLIPISAEAREKRPEVHFRAYGLGWVLNDYFGRKIVSHGGGYDGMFSKVILVPEEHFGVVVLTNSMTDAANAMALQTVDEVLKIQSGHDWHRELREEYRRSSEKHRERVARVLKPAATTFSVEPIDQFTGTFHTDLYGDVLITNECGKLVMAMAPNPDLVADLKPIRANTFAIHWRKKFAWFEEGVAQFLTNSEGSVVQLAIDVPNNDLWFDELELKKLQ
jgi:CubicO group peptidase (beta-lactamase class C family)